MAPVSKLKDPLKVPEKMKEIFSVIATLTDHFCEVHLNDEYRDLIRKVLVALCRKRPSPPSRGRRETWAAGAIHAIGMANFLFDKSQSPYLPSSSIREHFGLGCSSVSAKSKAIRDALRIDRWNSDWMLESSVDSNPLVWMISVDGYILDVRHLPVEIQQEAYDKGLISYLPKTE